MIVGENFVFVHNPKTGGSSIRNALLPFGVTDKQHAGIFPPRGYNSKTFRICVVRNPFDRMVSGYEYSQRNTNNKQSFEDWVLDGKPWQIGPFDFKRVPQLYWHTGCNRVLRFENLENEFNGLVRELGIDAVLPHVNKSVRTNYQSYYTPELIKVVEDRFKPDLEQFGYVFDETS